MEPPVETLAKLIRQCLTHFPGQHKLVFPEDPALMPAAVLVPLIERPNAMTILLTIRSQHLHHHPGQISFPGGGVEADDPDVASAALREAQEELGIPPAYVEVIGCLDTYQTITGFIITPVVGLIKPGFELVLDPFEVAEVFEIPLALALDASNYQRQRITYNDKRRCYYLLPYAGYEIWGATAGILMNFAKKMSTYKQFCDLYCA
jgi:8-oxo-dGTP pyrophosphatase MutT (NUDIX family)